MCVQTQRSSEEAFRFFGRNLRFLEEAFQFAVGAAPQTHFGKVFRMSASFFLTRTVRTTMLSSGVYVTEFKYIQVMSESVESALQLVDSDVTQQTRFFIW